MPIRKITVSFAGLIFMIGSGFGQSLGDVARTQRQKQSDKPANSAHKVITDEDIPAHSEDSKAATSTADEKNSDPNSEAPLNTASNGEELKAQCLSAKQQIKDFQSQLDKLRASIQYVEANRYSNGVQYNQHQMRKQEEADRMQKQLDQAKKKFADLQERARKAGFGSSVYDP